MPKSADLLMDLLPHLLTKRWRRWREVKEVGAAHPLRTAMSPSRYVEFKRAQLHLLPSGSLRDLRVVVDVGANIGDWSSALLNSTRLDTLIAIEPNPAVVGVLHERLAWASQARVVDVAVGAERGTLPFHATVGTVCGSLLVPRKQMEAVYGGMMRVQTIIEVPVQRLDDVLADVAEVSLLKIDVQGGERAVLAGASTTLGRTKMLLIEVNFVSHYEGDILFSELHPLLERHGFMLINLSPPFRIHGKVLWADALYFRMMQ